MDWIPVRGESMSPFLREGDHVGVEWLEQEDLMAEQKVGDIFIARDEIDGWIVHRMVAQGPCLKGDSSLDIDKPTSQMLWARVRAVKGRDGRQARFAPNAVDSIIAIASRQSLVDPQAPWSRILRKAAQFLGFARRAILK